MTEGLGAAEAGLKIDRGYIVVDEFFRTGVPGISAVGDVISLGKPGHPQLAHVSTAEGIATAERIAGQPPRSINYDQVPGCTFCDPEIGSIGLTEQKAKERGYDVKVGSFPFMALGRAKIAGETEGFVKIVADKKYDEVLGVHIIGPRATDLICGGVGRAAARVHRRGAGPDDPRAPDVRRGDGRSGPRAARRRDQHLSR